MTAENDEQDHFDLSHLDHEELLATAEALHQGYHELLEERDALIQNITSIGWSLTIVADNASTGDVLGMRAKALRLIRMQLMSLAATGLGGIGLTLKDVKEAEEFSDIAARLEADPTFNQDSPQQ